MPTAFLSDIHGNSPALRAVLDDIQRVGCRTVFMLGDIINGVDPHGCVGLLRSWADRAHVTLACLQGNAEAYLITPDRDRLIPHSPPWKVDLIHLLQWFQDQLSPADLDWIYTLPSTLRWNTAQLVHDSPMDRDAVQSMTAVPPEYREIAYHGRGIAPEVSDAEWATLTEHLRRDGVTQRFCGHTHRPFLQERGGYLVCNVGSAGMPLDGDPRPSWALLAEDDAGVPSVTIRRVHYDLSAILDLIDRTPDYYDFRTPGMQAAYTQMFVHAQHWRTFLPSDT